jgi:hypothetical protein
MDKEDMLLWELLVVLGQLLGLYLEGAGGNTGGVWRK